MTWALSQTQSATEQPRRRASFFWCDAIVSLVMITAAMILIERLQYPMGGVQPVLAVGLVWAVLMVALWTSNVYVGIRRNTGRILVEIGQVSIIVMMSILAAEALVGSWIRARVPPDGVALALFLCAGSMMACRVALAYRHRDDTETAARVIVVGTGVVARDIVGRLERSGRSVVLGHVDDDPMTGPVLGSIAELPDLCRALKASRVIVCFTRSDVHELLPILRSLPSSVAVDLVPRYFELVGWGARIEDFSGLSLVALPQRCNPAKRDRVKRVFDVVLAGAALIVVSPILIVSALAVVCTTGRPVLFRQERLGRNCKPFQIAKLRTLREPDESTSASSRQSPPKLHSEMVAGRATPVGKLLRRTGIDELPQLLNVLAGHMSLVGPRPFIPEECWALKEGAERRFDVRPGMTGLWQVSGQHSLRLDELVRLDTYYVDTWTFRNDVRIMAKTPSRLWRGGGDGVAKLVLESSYSSDESPSVESPSAERPSDERPSDEPVRREPVRREPEHEPELMKLRLPAAELKGACIACHPRQGGETMLSAAYPLCDAFGVVGDVDGVRKQLATHRPVRHDERSEGVDGLVGGAHHRAGFGRQGHDHVSFSDGATVRSGIEETGERHVGRGQAEQIGSPSDVAGDLELAVGHEGCCPDQRFGGLVRREPADAEHAAGHPTSTAAAEMYRARQALRAIRSPFPPLPDHVDPWLRSDRATVDVGRQPSVQGLEPGGDGIALRPERPRMAVKDDGTPGEPGAGQDDEACHQGGIGHDEASRTTPHHVGQGVQRAQDVPDRGVGSPARLGGEEAMSFAAQGPGDLPGPATDSAPGDEGHRGSVPRPSVSVVVASRNRRHMLRPFVEAVAGDPAATEVVIVLDGDVDGSYECLTQLRDEFPNLCPILGERRGQLAALDLGVQRSRGDVVLLMDDDVVARPGLVTGHAERHADMQPVVVVGFMPVCLQAGASVATRLYATEYEAHCARFESGDLAVLDGLWLGNVSARRSDVLRTGLASDRYPVFWHSDTDLGIRLREAGVDGVFDRRLEAAHMHAQSTTSFLRAGHERGQGLRLLQVEHGDRFGDVRPDQMLEGLPSPARHALSFLGREGRAGWSSTLLMALGGWLDRFGLTGMSARLARLARRIQIVCGFRCEVSRESSGESEARAPQGVSNMKS